jgi:hypothetical protein
LESLANKNDVARAIIVPVKGEYMRCKKLLGILSSIVTAAVVFQLSGCSVIGLGLGAISDASSPSQYAIPGWKAETLKKGMYVTALHEDGTKTSGTYIEIERFPFSEYSPKYVQYAQKDRGELILPALGHSVDIKEKSGKRLSGKMLGFDFKYLSVTRTGETEPSDILLTYMFVESENGLEEHKVNTGRIMEISDSEGNEIKGDVLENHVSEGKVPLMSGLAIQTELGKKLVDINEIQTVEVKVKRRGWLAGLVIGAIIDVAIIIGLSQFSISPLDTEN